MRTRPIKPDDLTDPLFDHRGSGELESLRADLDAVRSLLTALVDAMPPSELMKVAAQQFGSPPVRYERADDGSWGVELTAEVER